MARTGRGDARHGLHRREQTTRRSRRVVMVLLGLGAVALAAVALIPRSSARVVSHRSTTAPPPGEEPLYPPTPPTTEGTAVPPPPSPPYAVGTTTTTLVDTTRLVYPPHTADGKPDGRTLSVSTRYPALGTPASGEVPGAPPSTRTGPYPLVVFAPGYDQTSQPYAAMLDAWARAGYVVASPVFPLTNPATPGGPDENDIVNQPADVSFVIGQLLAQSSDPGNYLRGMIDPTEVALAGQSDGASTALAAAADTCCKDARVKAEIIMAGQEIDISNGSYYPAGTPPLLAMQGTDDTINDPGSTYQLFDADPSTKFLVKLIGADHLSPFTDSPSFEPIVARVSTDFLDHYLKNDVAALQEMHTDTAPSALATIEGS